MAPLDRAAGKPLFLACLSKPDKRVTKNLFLHRSIVGAAAGVAEGEVHMKIARHSRVLDNVDCRANDKRRDAVRFKVSRDQTHGLVTNGSQRNEEGDVDFIFSTQFKQMRGVDLCRIALRIIRGHGVEALTKLADNPFAGSLIKGA